jgi:hypothetical protein
MRVGARTFKVVIFVDPLVDPLLDQDSSTWLGETLQSRFDESTIITGSGRGKSSNKGSGVSGKAISTACSFSDLELDVTTLSGVNIQYYAEFISTLQQVA